MKKKLLFVCVENSNRSQMSQALATMIGGDKIEAYSAGSKPSGKVNPKAIASMKELGYDLGTHKSKSLEEVKQIAPFDVVVTITNIKQDQIREAGEKLYREMQAAGLDVLLDDRDERAGVKFKDADLIGIPYRVTIGKKIADGAVELFDRRAKQSEDVKLADIVSRVQTLALSA